MATNYWKTKVVPKIKKIFEKNGTKKKAAAAAAASKTFDESKEQYTKECEEKKSELQSKVVEIYEASSAQIKSLVKERKLAGLEKHSAAVQEFLDELVKIEFPGSKEACEACSKFGPSYVSGPVFFVFEKVSTFVVTEETKEEDAAAATTTAEEEKPSAQDQIAVEEEKKAKDQEKKKDGGAAEKIESPAEAAVPVATPEKAEEAPPAEPPKA